MISGRKKIILSIKQRGKKATIIRFYYTIINYFLKHLEQRLPVQDGQVSTEMNAPNPQERT